MWMQTFLYNHPLSPVKGMVVDGPWFSFIMREVDNSISMYLSMYLVLETSACLRITKKCYGETFIFHKLNT